MFNEFFYYCFKYIDLNKLRRLDLDKNQIKMLSENSFRGLHDNLEYLTLTANPISFLKEGILGRLDHLEQLYLDETNIEEISENFLKGPTSKVSFFVFEYFFYKIIYILFVFEWEKIYKIFIII